MFNQLEDTRQDSHGRLRRSSNAENCSQLKNVTEGLTDLRTDHRASSGVACPWVKTHKFGLKLARWWNLHVEPVVGRFGCSPCPGKHKA